jgi:YcaO-like protein with predicted kinase domain
MMPPRSVLREGFARKLNALPLDFLFEEYQITRIADLTGLDVIGVPVYSSCRPEGRVVSVNAGKSVSREMSRAGAIAEGIEFSIFDEPKGDFYVEAFPKKGFPVSRGSVWTPKTRIALDEVTHLASGESCLIPSDLVWLTHRDHRRPNHFQMSSNGQAVGYCLKDALLSGLYECIERDAVALRMMSLESLNFYPPKVDLSSLPPALADLWDRCENLGLVLFLFLCTVDVPVPVYWALLFDPWEGVGTYAGWGASLSQEVAAERAILEAIQSRAVVISGARDDILRRNFDALKSFDSRKKVKELAYLKPSVTLTAGKPSWTADHELSELTQALGPWANNVFFKHVDDSTVSAVKVVIPGLEQPHGPLWVSSGRWDNLRGQHEFLQEMAA